jgi:hypothetical protein
MWWLFSGVVAQKRPQFGEVVAHLGSECSVGDLLAQCGDVEAHLGHEVAQWGMWYLSLRMWWPFGMLVLIWDMR